MESIIAGCPYMVSYRLPNEYLSDDLSSDGGTKYLAEKLKNPEITKLSLSGVQMGDEGIKDFAHGLKDSQVIILDLGMNRISNDGMKHLAEGLKGSQVQILRLENNQISDDGIKHLAESLKDSHIQELELSDNQIGDDGGKYLAQVLEYTQITDLGLEENHISTDGARFICEVLDKTKIKSLGMWIHLTKNYDTEYIKFDKLAHAGGIRLTFGSNKLGAHGAKNINEALRKFRVHNLKLASGTIDAVDAQCLTEAFRNIEIGFITYIPIMDANNIRYLIEAFKDSKIVGIDLTDENLSSTGIKNLSEFLKEVNIIDLNLCNTNLGDECIEHLASALKNNTLWSLDLTSNDIGDVGVKFLAEVLKDSHIISLYLKNNRLEDKAVQYLADSLVHSQVTMVDLSKNSIGDTGYQYLENVINNTFVTFVNLRKNKLGNESISMLQNMNVTLPVEITRLFRNIVKFNPLNDRFEFTINRNDFNPSESIDRYVFFIKTLNDDPFLKVHIFNQNHKKKSGGFDFVKIDKIKEFIESLPDMFNTFFNNELLSLMELAPDYDYVNLVKQFEDLKLYDIVYNLLSHRRLYYIDENQKILHPYIHKMMHKYNMSSYNEQLEPSEKRKRISYVVLFLLFVLLINILSRSF